MCLCATEDGEEEIIQNLQKLKGVLTPALYK